MSTMKDPVTVEVEHQLAELEQLIEDFEHGKPLVVPPELQALARQVVVQEEQRRELTEEEESRMVSAMAHFVAYGPGGD